MSNSTSCDTFLPVSIFSCCCKTNPRVLTYVNNNVIYDNNLNAQWPGIFFIKPMCIKKKWLQGIVSQRINHWSLLFIVIRFQPSQAASMFYQHNITKSRQKQKEHTMTSLHQQGQRVLDQQYKLTPHPDLAVGSWILMNSDIGPVDQAQIGDYKCVMCPRHKRNSQYWTVL